MDPKTSAPGQSNPEIPELPRIGFFTSEDRRSVAWDRLREKQKPVIRDLILNEARKLGMLEPSADAPGSADITADVFFATVNALIGVGAEIGKCTPSELSVLVLSSAERAALDEDRINRLLKKYFGTLQFKWMDECILGVTALLIAKSKIEAVRALRAKNITPWGPRPVDEDHHDASRGDQS